MWVAAPVARRAASTDLTHGVDFSWRSLTACNRLLVSTSWILDPPMGNCKVPDSELGLQTWQGDCTAHRRPAQQRGRSESALETVPRSGSRLTDSCRLWGSAGGMRLRLRPQGKLLARLQPSHASPRGRAPSPGCCLLCMAAWLLCAGGSCCAAAHASPCFSWSGSILQQQPEPGYRRFQCWPNPESLTLTLTRVHPNPKI